MTTISFSVVILVTDVVMNDLGEWSQGEFLYQLENNIHDIIRSVSRIGDTTKGPPFGPLAGVEARLVAPS